MAADPVLPAGSLASAPMSPASRPTAERRVLYWYDPMMPAQKFDKPGPSPFMDMALVPRYAEPDAAPVAGTAPSLAVSAQARQALGLRLARVSRQTMSTLIEAGGTLQLNERDLNIVQARGPGFVERVHGLAPGDVVAAGAPLVDLFYPEWLAAQQEFLAIQATGDAVLTQAAQQRLRLLGLPIELIDRVARGRQAQAVQRLLTPSAGVITELAVRPGMTVAAGTPLVRINGLATLWLEAAVPEALAARVRPGQAVQVRLLALPGELITGRVAAVLSEANRETRTLRLRIVLPNPGGRLHAGLSAAVNLTTAARVALVAPAEAVVRTGRRALVYLAEGEGRFRPVEVVLGEIFNGPTGELIEVVSGLVAGQQVVASGQFLIDSEASLQGIETVPSVPGTPAAPVLPVAPVTPAVKAAPVTPAVKAAPVATSGASR